MRGDSGGNLVDWSVLKMIVGNESKKYEKHISYRHSSGFGKIARE